LTEERRQDLAKLVRQRVEEGKVALRNVRHKALEDLREFKDEKLISEDEFYTGKEKLQEITNRYSEQMDEISSRKQKEILES
jgi:ribosome recycling factor